MTTTEPPQVAQRPRITPGDRSAVGTVNWLISDIAGRVSGTTTPNLFLTLGRHRKLFRGWLRFAGRMMPGGRLPRRDTELVILRVAQLRRCTYELEHHIHLGAKVGIGAAEVERLQIGSHAQGWTARERAILAAVESIHERGDLSDGEFAALADHLDERSVIELVLLVGHYEMLATTIAALRIQPDARRRG